MSELGTASVAALRQYLRAAHARGIHTTALLQEAGLTPDLVASDDGRVDGEQLQTFLHLLSEHSQNPILGLETGDFVQPGSYSVLGYITMSCATLGEAIARIAPFEKLVGDMGVTRLEEGSDTVSLVWQCAFNDPVVRPHLVDNVFASWIRFARWLADDDSASPTEVHLQRSEPETKWIAAYAERWSCPVSFGARDNRVVLAKDLLKAPLRQPDPLLRKTLEAHAHQQLAILDTDTALTTRVKHSIQQQLMQGITRQDMIASHLGMTSRTLQRKLSQEGVSYQSLLDAVRQAMAEDLLENSELAIPDIGERLGYSETASFHRKFKSVTGLTPGVYRSKKRDGIA
ncbi:AraC family transcriptional regulator [Marinobacter salicampi]|uniref:AraC family transcriptional regulator n=1 Tax=Marinobacter salicampi TaxID=435907 RepID=UPI00140D3CA0|nr:AraC family transcriptional regulator [Marinobacter salicampi]